MGPIQRSRAVVGALATALLLTVSGCGADGPDRPASSAPSATTTESATESPDGSAPTTAATTPATTDEPADATEVSSTGTVVSAPFADGQDGDEPTPLRWLVPWDDGFLAVGVRMAPQQLPDEFPAEIADLFPPEVTDLFPDGLPPTQQEAIDILNEAGLFDAVMQVFEEHPEAQDAVAAAPQPDAELVAAWSADGGDWTGVDIMMPPGLDQPSVLSVYGGRMTVAGTSTPVDERAPRVVTIASTTDLESWSTRSIDVEMPSNLPDEAGFFAGPSAVAANDDMWAVDIRIESHVDPFDVLAPDVQERLMAPNVGSSFDPEGVTLETMDGDEIVSTERYTWAELGVSEETVSDIMGMRSAPERWSGQWDDPSVTRTPVPEPILGPLVATSAGILATGGGVSISTDGRSWTGVTTPVPNLHVDAAVALGDDVLVMAATVHGGTSLYVMSADGSTWSELEVPGLDEPFTSWSSETSSPAFVLEVGTPLPEPDTVVVEHEGFELTQEFGAVQAYQLVDLSTGEVLVAESVDLTTTEVAVDGPFEHLNEDMSGITISDPGSGETVVQIPRRAMEQAWENLQDAHESDLGHTPDFWLLATAEGETWLLEDLDDPDESEWAPPRLTASNGEFVLVTTTSWEPYSEVWQRYSLVE